MTADRLAQPGLRAHLNRLSEIFHFQNAFLRIPDNPEHNRVDIYRYLTDLFKALPYAKSADDYEALLDDRSLKRIERALAKWGCCMRNGM